MPNYDTIRRLRPDYADASDAEIEQAMVSVSRIDRAEIEQGDFARGLGNYVEQIPGMVGAVEALASEGMRRTVGEGPVGNWLREDGLRRMKESQAAQSHKPTDEFDKAWDKGLGGLIDWGQYQAGNLVGNLGEMGLAMATGGAAGVGVAAARKVSRDQALKYAARGATAGQVASVLKGGFGEVGGNAIEQKGLENVEFEKVVPASLAHAGLEFIGDKILASAAIGGGKNITKVADAGFKRALAENYVKRAVPAFAKEGSTELLQTALERVAADQSLDDPEAMRQYLNSFMAGGAMGGMASAAGAVKDTVMGQKVDENGVTRAERGIMTAGHTLGTVAGEASEAIGRAMRPKTSSPDFMRFSNPLPEGLDDQQLKAAADERNVAAVQFAEKVLAEDSYSTPEEMEAGAVFKATLMKATQPGEADAAVAKFTNDFAAAQEKKETQGSFTEALSTFTEAAQRRGNKQGVRTTESDHAAKVAQSWMQRNGKLTEIFPGLDVNDAQVRNGAQALFDWVVDGMPNFNRASVALVQMWGQNAPEMLRSAYHAAASEGVAPKDFERMGKAVEALTNIVKQGDPRRNQLATMVRESMQDQVTTADIAKWDRTLQNYVAGNAKLSNKDLQVALKRDFGEFSDEVLALYERGEDELMLDQNNEQVDEDDATAEAETNDWSSGIQETRGPQVEGVYHIKHDKGEMVNKRGEIVGAGLIPRTQGMWSRLRQDYADSEDLSTREDDLIRMMFNDDPHVETRIKNTDDREAMLRYIDRNFKALDSLEPSQIDAVDLTQAEVEAMTHKRKDAQGRITLQRAGKPFYVNVGSIIAVMRNKLPREEGNKAAENHRMLMTGLSSLMNAGDFESVEAWDNNLFDPYTGMSLKQMQESVSVKKSDVDPRTQLQVKADELLQKARKIGPDDPAQGNKLMTFRKTIVDVLATNDERKINKLHRKLNGMEMVDDRPRVAADPGVGETQEMADAANEKAKQAPEGDRGKGFDRDMLGAAIDERDITPVVGRKQTDFITKLLEQGVPTFVTKVKAMTEQQRFKTRAALRELVKTERLEGEMLKRAENALKALRGKEERRGNASAQAATGKITEEQKTAVREELTKLVGDKIKVSFERIFGGRKNKQEWSGEWVDGAIRISIKALDPLGVGRHEALHQLMKWLRDAKAEGVEDVLKNVATNPLIQRQLARELQNDPAALEQLKDPEEAAAYLYQFWKANKINLGPKLENWFTKVMHTLRSWTGLLAAEVRDMQHAEQILQAFDAGEFKNNNTEAMQKLDATIADARNTYAKGLWGAFLKNDVLRKVAFTAGDVLRDMKIPSLDKLADLLYTPEGTKMSKQAFFDAVPQQRAVWLNRLNDILKDVTPEDAHIILKHMQGRTEVNKIHDPYIRERVEQLREYLSGEKDSLWQYSVDKGVKRWNEESGQWESMGKIMKYFPRVFDMDKLLADRAGFTARLLEHHRTQLESMAKQNGVTAEEIAENIADRIITAQGNADINESSSTMGITPAASAVNKRDLIWLDDSKFTDYMSDDISDILTNYTMQLVKRAEYTSRFGNEGEIIQAHLNQAYAHLALEGNKKRIEDAYTQLGELEQQYHDKKAQGIEWKFPTLRDAVDKIAKPENINDALKAMQMPIKAVMAAEGTIGRDINESFRQASSFVMFYQNLRLLTLSLFSSFIDPLGMIVRGGTLDDAYQGFVRGIKEIRKQISGDYSRDELQQLAERLGTVDAHSFLDALGQTYSSLYMTGKVKHWNDKLFRFNGMEAWNRAMRIQATGAAVSFIEKHLTKPTENSQRWLEELGLTSKTKFSLEDEAVQQAVVRWVNGAILRPNAMQRPIYASDPHYALLYHLKQFTYSFHKTILRRAFIEAQHGNLTPAVSLVALYVPMMIAADVLKETLAPGDEPAWMKAGLGSAVSHGVLRANLMGVPQFAVEGFTSPFGKEGLFGTVDQGTKLFGPTAEQVFDWLMVPLTEKYGAYETGVRSLPHTPLFSRALL